MFKPGRRHLYVVPTDGSEPTRTLCGVSLPREVRWHLRGVATPAHSIGRLVAPTYGAELDRAEPCGRCYR